MNSVQAADVPPDPELLAMLDAAIADLPAVERKCVILTRLQGRSYEEAAQLLGITPEAARKRVSRAIDRLRESFAAHGHTVASSSVAGLFVQVSPPPELAVSTSNVAQLTAMSSANAIAQGVRKMFLVRKVIVMGVVGLAVTTCVLARNSFPLASTRTTATTLPVNSASFDLGDGVYATFVGVATLAEPGRVWGLDGKPVTPGPLPTKTNPQSLAPRPTHRIYLSVKGDFAGNPDATASGVIGTVESRSTMANGETLIELAVAPKEQSPASVEIKLADREWRDLCPGAQISGSSSFGGRSRSILASSWYSAKGGCEVFVVTEPVSGHWTAQATLTDGRKMWADFHGGTGAGNMVGQTLFFPVAREKVEYFELKYQPFTKALKIENITLIPGVDAKSVVTVVKGPPSP